MTPYRHETLPEGQPVRFYKIVAVTFLILTVILLGVIIFSSSKKAVITVTTKQDPVEVNFAVEVNSPEAENKIEGKIVTTTVELFKTYQPTETKELLTGAEGTMILHNDGSTDQALVATTRLKTSGGAIYRMKNKAMVPANGQVKVEVYFDEKNTVTSTGVGKLTIPGLNEDRQKIIYATNDTPITGTKKIGVVSEDDLKKANKDLTDEMGLKAKDDLTSGNAGLVSVFKITDQTITTTAKLGEEADQFTLKGRAMIVAVLYKQDEVDVMAKKELAKQIINDAEILQTGDNSATVTLAEFDSIKMSAKLNVYYNGVVTLNAESKQLAKESFFGKSEQEVRRYLLSLDHVKGVEMNFSPAWTRTIPSLADHVSVVVKTTE